MSVNFQKIDDILGINRRNLDVIQQVNPRSAFPLVDDKTRTKALLTEIGVPVPGTIHVVRNFPQIEPTLGELATTETFVVKPARGRAGGGVLLAERVAAGGWQTPSGRALDSDELRRHLGDILFGVYSFGRMDDAALIEERVVSHEFLSEIYEAGIADIRIITFGGSPVMSMLRIPTHRSDGKANLHQGAIGVGIDTATGITRGAVYRGEKIDRHPDSDRPLTGLAIPHWHEVTNYARQAAAAVPLGYLGIDFVLDRNRGPLILELNARPGLQIQVINQTGLAPLIIGAPS